MKKTTLLSLMSILSTFSNLVYAQVPVDGSVACIQSLCGTKNAFAHPFEQSPAAETPIKDLVEKELKHTLENYMGRIVHKAMVQDQLYGEMIRQKDKITVTAETAAIIQSFKYIQKFQQAQPAFEANSAGNYVFNPTMLKTVFPEFNPDQIDAMVSLSPVANFLVQSAGIFDRPMEVVLKTYYPSTLTVISQMYEAATILAVESKLTKLVPVYVYSNTDSSVVQKALRGETLSESEKIIFRNKIRMHFILQNLLSPEIQAKFAKIPLNVSEQVDNFQKIYANGQKVKVLKDPAQLRKVFQESVGTCSSRISYAYAALPTEAQKQNFLKTFEQIKSSAQTIVEERTKTSAADAFKLEVHMPSSRELLLPNMKQSIKDRLNFLDVAIGELKKVDVSDGVVLGSIFAAASTYEDVSVFEDFLEFCDQAKAAPLNDAASSLSKIINLGWPTIAHPEYGIGVVAHEFGHIASNLVSMNLSPEKSCLMQKQASSKFLEEDFADLFSNEVVRRLGGKVGDVKINNFACALQTRTGEAWNNGDLKNPNVTDPHSSNFYRMMSVAATSTGLTNQCRAFLGVKNEARFNEYCKWKP